MTMADKIVVLNAGRIEQVGTPLDLYHHPRNRFVAGFIGNPTMNFIAGQCTAAENGRVTIELPRLGSLTLNRSAPHLAGETVTVGVRPEHVALGGGEFSIEIMPRIIEHLGIHTIVYADLASGEQFTSLFEGDTDASEGKPMRLGWSPSHVHLFDKDGIAVA
jgi:multiple sugar transport system ATP-binding protein